MSLTYVPNPEYLKQYTASEIVKNDDGRIYLKEGVEKRWTDVGASLEGTLPAERNLTGDTSVANERTLPDDQIGGIANFKDVLRTTALASRSVTRPTVDAELNRYADAGVPMTAPSTIANALEAGTLGRSEVEGNVFSGVLDLVKEQEERRAQTAQFASDLLGTIAKDPSLMASLTGQDFEEIKAGVVSSDLMARIGAAAQAPKTLEAIKDSGVILPDEDYARLDRSLGLPSGTSKQIGEISATEKRLRVAGLAADLSGKTFEQANNLYSALEKIPAGTPVEIDGNLYYGLMGTGKLEIDSGGFGRMFTVNPYTGQQVVKDLGFMGKTQDGWTLSFDGNGQPWRFNTKTGDLVFAGDASDPTTPNAVGADWSAVIPDGTIGGQCGVFVRKMTGIHVGDTLESKMAVIDKTPGNVLGQDKPVQVGDAIVMNIGTHGHIGIVEAIVIEPENDPNLPSGTGRQMIKIMDSNINGDERVAHHWVSADDQRIMGFARGNLSPALAYGTDTPATPSAPGAQVGQGAGPGQTFAPKAPAKTDVTMIDGKPFTFKTDASGATVAVPVQTEGQAGADPRIGELTSIIGLIDEITASPYLGQVTGAINPLTYWTPGTNEQYVKAQIKQLKSFLALENRQKLKGQGTISDREFKVLTDAATALDSGLSDADAVTEIGKLRTGLQDRINELTGEAPVNDSAKSLKDQVRAKGYDYDKMKAAGWSDERIKSELGL